MCVGRAAPAAAVRLATRFASSPAGTVGADHLNYHIADQTRPRRRKCRCHAAQQRDAATAPATMRAMLRRVCDDLTGIPSLTGPIGFAGAAPSRASAAMLTKVAEPLKDVGASRPRSLWVEFDPRGDVLAQVGGGHRDGPRRGLLPRGGHPAPEQRSRESPTGGGPPTVPTTNATVCYPPQRTLAS